MKTPRQIIAEAMDEEKMMYDSDEANADQIIAALTSAGYAIVPVNEWESRMPEYEDQ